MNRPTGGHLMPRELGAPRLSHPKTAHFQAFFDGANRDRTGDLLLAKQALSQLSYGPWKAQYTAVELGSSAQAALRLVASMAFSAACLPITTSSLLSISAHAGTTSTCCLGQSSTRFVPPRVCRRAGDASQRTSVWRASRAARCAGTLGVPSGPARPRRRAGPLSAWLSPGSCGGRPFADPAPPAPGGVACDQLPLHRALQDRRAQRDGHVDRPRRERRRACRRCSARPDRTIILSAS
jgi:hypothetical protein